MHSMAECSSFTSTSVMVLPHTSRWPPAFWMTSRVMLGWFAQYPIVRVNSPHCLVVLVLDVVVEVRVVVVFDVLVLDVLVDVRVVVVFEVLVLELVEVL